MDPEPNPNTRTGAAGTITFEYYNEGSGSTDLSESSEENRDSGFSPPLSPPNRQTIKSAAEFKTYDFQHWELQQEVAEEEMTSGERQYFSDVARDAIAKHYNIMNQEYMDSLKHAKGNFNRCPRGAPVHDSYYRRKFPGPFQSCCFGHTHECGDEFFKIPIHSRPSEEADLSTRPHHLKERKAKFFKQCKNCECNGFTHHRNPAQHYEDYVNHVTYRQQKNLSKVWPQHLADLKHSLEDIVIDKSDPDYVELAKKCQEYRPSTVIVSTTRIDENFSKKRTVIARKRTTVTRPVRRPSSKAKNSKNLGYTTSATTHREEATKKLVTEVRNSAPVLALAKKSVSKSSNTEQRKGMKLKQSEVSKETASKRSSIASLSPLRTSRIGRTGAKTTNTPLHRRLKASVARLIQARGTESRISNKFVKKSKMHKEAKYIQKVKPNISAKFLRARSKGKNLNWSSNLTGASPSPTKNNRTRGQRGGKKREVKSTSDRLSKKIISASLKTSTKRSSTSNSNSDSNSNSASESESSEEAATSESKHEDEHGSYSQFRDHNGEFDTEKYRKSILKMLAKHSGTGAKRERKKQQRRTSPNLTDHKFVSLPKITNMYRNVKPKTVTNIPHRSRKRRKQKKSKAKSDAAFDILTISDLSLKSKFSTDTILDKRDSYFSIPSLDDVKIQ